MKTLVLIAVITLAAAAFHPYDGAVTPRDRSNIYIDCAFATSHMLQVYHDSYWNNWTALINAIIDFLKNNALYVILTPYVQNDTELANYEALWVWLGTTIRNHCCGLDLIYYLVDNIVSTIWSRIDLDKFRELLWANLNKYTTMSKYYWDEFWMACPFTYWELYTNYIKPHIKN